MVDITKRNLWDKPVGPCPIQIYRKEWFLARICKISTFYMSLDVSKVDTM